MSPRRWTATDGLREGSLRLWLALAIALLATAAAALASTGALIPGGCIGDVDNNPAACSRAAAGLDFAYSVAVSADGKSVYAAGAQDNAIVRFQRDKTTGVLTPRGCVGDSDSNPDACAQTAQGLGDADSVAVSGDGKSVYAASCCGDHAIVHLKRNRTTGALTPEGCIGDDDFNPGACARTAKGLEYAAWVTVSADGKSVYVAGYETGMIARFERNRTTGALTPKGCIADPANNPDDCGRTAKGLDAGTSEHSVAVSADGRSAYVSGDGDNAIVRFKRDRKTGALTPKGCIADAANNPDHCGRTARGLGGAWAVALSADGKSLYAVSQDDNAIVRFKRNRTTGALRPNGCIADPANNPDDCGRTAKGLGDAARVAVSADGKSVYVASQSDNAIVRFRRDRTTGALTPKGCIADPANNPGACARTAQGLHQPYSVAVSDDGRSVYAASLSDNAIVRFDRQR